MTEIPNTPRGLKYERLLRQLKKDIAAGVIKPGTSLKSESQLCSEFGVSRGPVRQALSELERERLIYKIPGKGTFVSDHVGGRRKGTPVKRIHVLLDASAGLDDNFVAREVIEGLNSAMRKLTLGGKLHYEFHRFSSDHDYDDELLFDGNDGVIVVPFTRACVRFIENLRQTPVPVVALFDKINSEFVSNYYIDHEESAYRVTELLLRYGHRRIGFVVDTLSSISFAIKERLAGYQRGLAECGVQADASWIVGGGLDPVAVRDSVSDLLGRPERPTAILIGGGLFTVPCSQAIRAAGLHVPDDISVVAFDDTVEALLHEPPLSVVKQPLVMLAERGLERLLSEISQPLQPPVQVAMSPELVLRRSHQPLATT